MSSYPAPTQNIDFFNPAFFTVDETPLTVADANKLYFKKSGGIITGAVSAPSLTLNGTNVENKLTEIDVNSTKLTDIIYNNNTTSILNDLSVDGVLKLPNLPNAGTDILSNKQKTTKILYDAGTSVTTVADTLKASSTLIVGSQNYNASDEFFKLTDVAKNGNNLTINDNLFLSTGYRFELGTITDVEQKIIDVSNGITPHITYDTITDKLDFEKDIILSNVIIGERSQNPSNGSGIMIRTLLNPSSNVDNAGSIFEVRSTGYASRLWVGQDLTTAGFNKFMFGYKLGTGSEGNPANYYGKLDTDGSIVCTRLDVSGGDINCNGNFELGTITDVEQKIIDVSNGITPFISYNTTTGNIEVEKNMDLSVNELNCNFMRKIGGVYRLSHNFNTSYLEFRNGGHCLDSKNADGTGRDLYLNFYAKKNIVLGSHVNNSTTIVNGNLNITEAIGTAPTAAGGSLTLTHDDPGGTSSIVFKSKRAGSDYGYISYIDDVNGGTGTRSVLELGVKTNPGNTGYVDNIALMPSGFVGINTKIPQAMLDVNGDTNITGNLKLGSILDVEDAINNATQYISYNSGDDELTVTKNMVLLNHDLTCKFMRPINDGTSYGLSQNWGSSYLEFKDGGKYLDSMNADGTGTDLFLNSYAESDIHLGSIDYNSTTYVNGNLNIDESNGTVHSALGGSLTLSHNDTGGMSSIVFKSRKDVNDYGYISYQDDYEGDDTKQRGLLAIGIQNDTDGIDTIDNIALMPSGFVGINTKIPSTTLDVNGNTKISGTLSVDGSSRLTGNVRIGSIANVEEAINNAGGVPSITYDEATETTTFDGNFIVIPSDLEFNLGPAIPDLYSHIVSEVDARIESLQSTAFGLKISNNTFIEADLGTRTSQLSIRPANDSQNAVQEIYSKNGTAELKIGDDNGTTLTFNNILKSENGNATFYGNDGGSETKYMEYNSTDDKINILKDMDLGTNNFDCRFMRTYYGGAKYFLSQNYNSSYLEFRNGGHQLDAFNTNGTGRSLILNSFAESDIVLGSTINNSSTIINGNLNIIENTGTPATASGGSLTLTHNDDGGTSSIVFKSKIDVNSDYGYISYQDNYGVYTQNSLLEIGVQNDAVASNMDNIALMTSGNVGIKTRTPQATLDVNGDISCNQMTMNNVLIGERVNNSTDGNGLMVQTLYNPSINSDTAGSIFEVRSSGNASRLWVGQDLTSSGQSKFMFGLKTTGGDEGNPDNYNGKLDTDGSVDCTEIKVNSIPINSFTNMTFLYNYVVTSANANENNTWGRGRKMIIVNYQRCYSHNPHFYRSGTNVKCDSSYYGTYLIEAHATFRNDGTGRVNPVIGIGINADCVNGAINDVNTGPNWETALTNGFCQHNIFSAQYTRNDQGEVSTLSCSRIYRFTSETENVAIHTFNANTTDTTFTDELTTYKIFNAGLSFRYLGNFSEPTIG